MDTLPIEIMVCPLKFRDLLAHSRPTFVCRFRFERGQIHQLAENYNQRVNVAHSFFGSHNDNCGLPIAVRPSATPQNHVHRCAESD